MAVVFPFSCVLLFLALILGKQSAISLHRWPEVSRSKVFPKTQQGFVSAAASAPCYTIKVTWLCSSLGQLISVIFLLLICPLVVLTHLWASCFQDPAVPPCNPPHPKKQGSKSLCCPSQLPTTLSAAKTSSQALLLPDGSRETSDFCHFLFLFKRKQTELLVH